jgi:hypothetical protein
MHGGTMKGWVMFLPTPINMRFIDPYRCNGHHTYKKPFFILFDQPFLQVIRLLTDLLQHLDTLVNRPCEEAVSCTARLQGKAKGRKQTGSIWAYITD